MPENIPNIPKTYHRARMTPAERVESYQRLAELIIKNITHPEQSDDPEDIVVHTAMTLAATYAEGYQDGSTYGVYRPAGGSDG